MGLLDVDYEKLAGNPLLQMGLGILANNQGHYGKIGPALGLGMRQGLLNTQQFKNSQTELDQRQQGLDISKAYRDSQARLNDIHMKKLQDYQDAIDQAAKENPQFGALLKVDPEGAFRALYPRAYQPLAQPYSSVEYDDQGNAYLFNHRETDPSKAMTPINVNGKNFVGGKMSPDLQGRIQGAKAENSAAWKPNNDFPGVLSTDAEVSRAANNNGMPSNNFNMPFPVYFGAPGTTKTDRQEGITKDSDIQILDPRNARPLPKGIKVPTPAEMARDKTAAETTVKGQGEWVGTIPEKLNSLGSTMKYLDRLESLNADDKTFASKGAEIKLAANSLAQAFGIPLNVDKTANSEQYIATISELLKSRLGSKDYGSGTGVSNLDLLAASAPLPELAKTRQGRAQIIQALKADSKSSYRNLQDARAHWNKNKNLDEWTSPSLRETFDQTEIQKTPIQTQQPKSIPNGAINMLKMNPKLRDQFDAKYGAGASDSVLGK